MRWRFLYFLLAPAGVSSCASAKDLTPLYDENKSAFCGVVIGQRIPPHLELRKVSTEVEGMEEIRSIAKLCQGSVTGELRTDPSGRVEMIVLTDADYCLQGVCMGENFPTVRAAHPRFDLFLTREEGGILTLLNPRARIRYSFDTGNIPGRCFDSIEACPTAWAAAKVAAIIIGAPTRAAP